MSYLRQSNNPHLSNNLGSSPNRSVSPIQYVKPSSVYYSSTISPSRSQVLNTTKKSVVSAVSPAKLNASTLNVSQLQQQDEIGLWKSRCNELETSLCQVNTDLELASFKAKKAKDLEGKVDGILKQNAQLTGENDQLSKQFSQKRTESDIWKSKYESQMNTIVSLKANYEQEIRRLQTELQNQRQLQDVIQEEKLKDTHEVKQQLITDNLTQMETLKRSHISNITLYEEQLRKLRDTVGEREKELQILQGKLIESRNYADSESNRLNEDKERLRAKISQLELDQAKEIENQKRRGEVLTLEQISALKKLHGSELDVLESELNKLKNLLEMKNNEIQVLITQNKQQKRNFENELNTVREENGALKDKLLENNRLKEEEVENLQNKLANLHTTDIANLKNRHESQVKLLNNENLDLQKIISGKSEEIENQLKEKVKQREAYNAEVDRLQSEIETQKLKQAILERDRQKEYEESQDALDRANAAHVDFADQQRKQVQFLESEIEKLKQLLVHKNNEIDVNIAQSRTIKSNLEEDIRGLKLELNESRKRFDNLEYVKNAQIDELRNKLQAVDTVNSERTRKFEAQIDYLENELKRTRESLVVKSEEANNHLLHRELLESESQKLNAEIDSLNNHIVLLEKLKAQEISDLRQKLEKSNNYTIESIQNSHNNQTEALLAEIDDLKGVIDLKDRELQEKAQQYSHIERHIEKSLSNSGVDVGEYQTRVSRINAAEATTAKNIYDVFVRSRQPSSNSGKKLMPNNSGVSPIKRSNDF